MIMERETEKGEQKMFEVVKTYYDSPREDCGGYYCDVIECETAKEAYKLACSINRMDEPVGADVDLKSGKPRIYKLFITGGPMLKQKTEWKSTTSYEEFMEGLKTLREIVRGLKEKCYAPLDYSFEIK